MAEMDYDDMFKCLPEDRQKELMDKKSCFAERAGIETLSLMPPATKGYGLIVIIHK